MWLDFHAAHDITDRQIRGKAKKSRNPGQRTIFANIRNYCSLTRIALLGLGILSPEFS